MEFMNLATLIEKGTPVLLLALLIISVVNTVFIYFLFASVKSIKEDIIWRDKYEADQNNIITQFDDIKRRIERLENRANGGV